EGDGRLSDAAVVHAVLNGDPDAYTVLVQRYQDVLYRYAEQMTGQPDVAAEIVQSALVKGYEKLDRCQDARRVGAWLFRINANQCKDYLKDVRRRDLSLQDARPLTGEAGPEHDAERGELGDRIREALARLTPEERQAFVLKHVEGFAYEEMAELLGASVGALKMRVHRAREALQPLLEEYR
ncbi:MAG TPA: sigma-70 family RNA polymerase sigma factor, partial [Gemmatimonadota bacterium]|nr:sigma-70 family RNA polymerase sigma factor [Gemmatimonadota bacterium]